MEHAADIRSAGARLVVFPELSLTGYDLDAPSVAPDDPTLRPIVDACGATGTVALVGAPVDGVDGARHIGTLRVGGDGVSVTYRKEYLGGDERSRFRPGDGAVTLDVDGWRIGLGICADTGAEQHISDIAALRVDAYVAGLVHRPDELDIQDERGARIARTCRAYVAFASFAGATGGGYERTAGTSTIWAPDGRALARAGSGPGEIATAVLRK